MDALVTSCGLQPLSALTETPPSRSRRIVRLRFISHLTQHGDGDDDANADNNRCRHNSRGDVFVLGDFLVQVTWRAVVEKFVAEDGRGDAGSREQKHVAQGLAEALGVPARSRRISASREDGWSGEENVRSD